MDHELWKKVDALLEDALAQPPDKREAFVIEVSKDNAELREEVLSLLKAQAKASNFMERSAIRVVAGELAQDSNLTTAFSLVGKELANYKIEKLLGAGGMGEVYLARARPITGSIPAFVQRSWFWPIAVVVVLVLAAIPLGWYLTRAKPVAPDWSRGVHVQLTTQPGTEYFPTFTPDGKSFVYASQQSGNYDLYEQRIGGKNATSITPNTPSDESQPAFSPNGERIAFRSNRQPSGVYVMEPTGENARLVMAGGFTLRGPRMARRSCAALPALVCLKTEITLRARYGSSMSKAAPNGWFVRTTQCSLHGLPVENELHFGSCRQASVEVTLPAFPKTEVQLKSSRRMVRQTGIRSGHQMASFFTS